MRWPTVKENGSGAWLAVPLGATEQHGPHLPLATDTRIATELAGRLAGARPWVWAAPALPYGASGEHAAFPGTISIGRQALETVLVELGRSCDHFAGLILVNGHGGNAQPAARAARRLAAEGRRCLAWSPSRPPGAARWDAHAGFVETSIGLALGWPELRIDLATSGPATPLSGLLPQLRSDGVAAVSANGVLGDPAGASAAEGKRLLEAFTAGLIEAVDAWTGVPAP